MCERTETRNGVPGNREHWPKNRREQGTSAPKQPGTGNFHEKLGDQGTLAQKRPGTRNIGPKSAGNREHWPKNSREQGTFYEKYRKNYQSSMEERYMRYYVKFGCLQVQNSHLRPFKSFFTFY